MHLFIKLFTGVDENACIILKYKDGAMANLIYHTSAGVGENNAVIYGDKGKIKVYCCNGSKKNQNKK